MPFKNKHPLYSVWQSMLRRCDNPNYPQYADYGGRGIKVCDQWLHNFKQFTSDMGERPKGYSLDRIDNDANYTPDNCKWSTRAQQQLNRRCTRKITIEGKTYSAWLLAKQYGFKADTLVMRSEQVSTFKELIDPNKRVYKAGLALGGMASGAKKQALTHCKNGHEFNPENTRITKQGWRDCRLCKRNKMRIRQGYGLAK